MRIDLMTHIVAGGLGILAGYVALAAAKGNRLHRRSGMVFVFAMLTMALMGSLMAVVRHVAAGANGPMGVLTAYLVITGLTTVRPPGTRSRSVDVALMAVVLAATATLYTFGIEVLASPTGKLYGMPAFPFLIFGTIGLLAAAGDLRAIRSGGVRAIHGTPRLVRHLWRMSTAFLIAAFSFFIGQAKIIPKPYRVFPVLLIPPLVVLAALLYWLWRLRVRRSLRGVVIRVRAVEAA